MVSLFFRFKILSLVQVRVIDLNENYFPDGTLDENNDLYENTTIYLDSNYILSKKNFTDLELISIFLTMFYSTNITQASFADVMKTFQMITAYDLRSMLQEANDNNNLVSS